MYCDWCEEKDKDNYFIEVGNDYVCQKCAEDLNPSPINRASHVPEDSPCLEPLIGYSEEVIG